MLIKLNGKEVSLDNATTIMDLIDAKGLVPDSVVVEYNLEILKKELWSSIKLKENDTLEVLRFVGGG